MELMSALKRHVKKRCSVGLQLLPQFLQCSVWKRFNGENGWSLLKSAWALLFIVLGSLIEGFLDEIDDPDGSRNFAAVLVYSLEQAFRQAYAHRLVLSVFRHPAPLQIYKREEHQCFFGRAANSVFCRRNFRLKS